MGKSLLVRRGFALDGTLDTNTPIREMTRILEFLLSHSKSSTSVITLFISFEFMSFLVRFVSLETLYSTQTEGCLCWLHGMSVGFCSKQGYFAYLQYVGRHGTVSKAYVFALFRDQLSVCSHPGGCLVSPCEKGYLKTRIVILSMCPLPRVRELVQLVNEISFLANIKALREEPAVGTCRRESIALPFYRRQVSPDPRRTVPISK